MSELQLLTEACGHHCGVITTGSVRKVAHCDCEECHGEESTHPRSVES